MTSYRGPNVSVKQQFELSPPAVAIDNLAPVSIATAYDVYSKEKISKSIGLASITDAWKGNIANRVIFDRTVAGDRVYDFYKPTVYVQSEDFGSIDITKNVSLSSAGIEIGAKQTYDIPGAGASVGSSKATIPYYNNSSAGIAYIPSSDKGKVFMNGVSLEGNGLVSGQRVFIKVDGSETLSAGVYEVGTIAAILQNGSVIKLMKPFSNEIVTSEVEQLVIGAASTTTLDIPNTIYDTSVNFTNLQVKSGDIIEFESNALTSTAKASVFSVINANTLFINTVAPEAPFIDIKQVETFTIATLGGTTNISKYQVKRLVGFSKNLNFNSVGVVASNASASSVDVSKVSITQNLKVGDKIAFTATQIHADPTAGFFEILDIIDNGATYTLNLDANPGSVDTYYVTAWTTTVSNDILADYRAIRSEENLVRHRITGPSDITNLYSKDDTISVYNDLAMMLFISLSIGNSAVYGVNVDSSSDNLAGEYSKALEEMEMVDVYSHAFGTTSPGVNSLAGAYCDSQSEPYTGHERVAILTYDEMDVYNIGSDSVNPGSDANTLVIDGAIDLLDSNVTVGDIVLGYDASGDQIVNGKVTLTPTSPTSVEVDSDFTTASTVQFLRGGRNARANAIKNIKYGNRRCKVIWPGWFQADFNDNTLSMVPPYYIAAARAGYDSLKNPSQSMTNSSYSIPGFSNYKLNTNFFFKKDDLDIIGGGGVDIQIQDSEISQSIYSRHDLTSNMDAIEYSEWSITKQADVAAKTYRSAYKPYPGKYNITPHLLEFARTIGDAVSKKIGDKGSKIVYSAQLISVARDELVKDKINFLVKLIVYVAANRYDITLEIKS